MNKKNKFLFLGLTLLLILVSVSSINATEDNDITTISDTTSTNNIINVEKTTPIEKDTVATDVKSKNKIIKNTQKDLKDVKTVKKVSNTTVNVNSSNYNQYFTNSGQLSDKISANSSIILNGNFENKTFQINKPGIYLAGKNSIIKNGQITITEKSENTTITNINIQISNSNITKAIDNQAMGVTLSNINITYNKPTGVTLGILNTAENVSILNNNIKIEGPNAPIDWYNSSSERYMKVNTAAISSQGDDITIRGNNVSVSIANGSAYDPYGTIDVIEIVSGNNVNIINNTIVASKASYVYAISAAITNSRVSNNRFNISSESYINAIQIGNMIATGSNVEVANNIITGVCKNTTPLSYDESKAYAIIASGVSKATNMNITNNTININATLNTGVELFNTENNTITNNKMNLTGVYSTGIKGNLAPNTIIKDNKINSTGNSSIVTYPGVYGVIYNNNAIYLENSMYVNITNNSMKVMDKGCSEQTAAIILNKSNTIKITDNIIDTSNDEKIIQNVDSSNIIDDKNTIYINGTLQVTHIITNNTISQYFIKENGYQLADNVSDHDILNFQGTIANLSDSDFKMVINKQVKIISTTQDAVIRNVPIVITTEGENTKIINLTIELIKQTGEAIPIKSTADNIEIINNTIKVEGPNAPIDWTYYPKSYVNTAAISSEGDDVTICGNNITVTKKSDSQDQAYGTIDAIEIINGNNVNIINNTISASKGVYVYAISATLNNSDISNNKFIINGETYINAIQLANPSFNVTITNNDIKGVCKNTTQLNDTESISYAIISSSRTTPGNNITITNNSININATLNTAIELYNTENSTINNNKMNLIGAYNTGIKTENAANSSIRNNTIIIKGNSKTTTIPNIYGAIYNNNAINMKNSPNTDIKLNNITVMDTGCSDQTAAIICTSSDNITIYNNIFDTSNIEDKAIQTITSNNITTQLNAIFVNGTRNGNTHIITNDTIEQFFIKENDYKLADNVLIGDTLDFQGTIADLKDSDFKIVINKPINIKSTTHNAIIQNIPITITSDAIKTNISNLNLEFESTTTITPIINNANDVKIINNTIKATSVKPITVIKSEDDNTKFIIENNTINAVVQTSLNNRTPLINTPSATVTNNKINLTDTDGESILGDEAVFAANISQNTPKMPHHSFVNITNNTPIKFNQDTNITIKIEGIYHQNITGVMNVTIDGKTYKINGTQSTITIHPNTMKVNINIDYIDENNNYLPIKNYSQILNVERSTNSNIQITVKDKVFAGETITITAIISDNGKLIQDGNVAFKLNGVTLKDANGNRIKVRIINGVATLQYTIPDNYSAKNYILTAVFSNGDYDRVEVNNTVTIIPSNVFIQPTSVYYENGKLMIKADIKDAITNKNVAIKTKVTLKINGKSFINRMVVENGIITVAQDLKFNNGIKTLTIVSGPNSKYNVNEINVNFMVQNIPVKQSKNSTQITINDNLKAKV